MRENGRGGTVTASACNNLQLAHFPSPKVAVVVELLEHHNVCVEALDLAKQYFSSVPPLERPGLAVRIVELDLTLSQDVVREDTEP